MMRNPSLPRGSGLRFGRLLFVTLAVFAAPFSRAQTNAPPEHRWWSDAVEKSLATAGTNRTELAQALRDAPAARRQGLVFLLENMPQRDLQSLTAAYLLENLSLAYDALAQAPWSRAIPEELFLNDILPYANINEKRDDWRRLLREKCLPLIKGAKTPGEAAQRINASLFGLVNVKYSTKRKKADQSPLESMESGLASCTGLTIILADACRSVGVPARLVGIPNWIDNRGNHTWVEVWDEKWHFTGAAEPDAHGLDHAWFEHDASLAQKDSPQHAIYAASFKKTPLPFPLVFARGVDYVSSVNVTDHYTANAKPADPAKTRLFVRVLDHAAGARVAASVRVADVANPSVHFEGASRDESADYNDILSFEAPKARSYQIHAEANGAKGVREIRAGDDDETVVLVYLDQPATSGADSSATPAPTAPAKALSVRQADKLKQTLAGYFAANPAQQAAWKFDHGLDRLLLDHDAAVRQVAWEAYQAAPIHATLRADFATNQVRFEQYLSPYTVKTVGRKPAAGWPLFIAMHGGGNTPKEVNDSQWRIMQNYYRDQTSVGGYLYVALRAPNDTWNGFYDDYVYPLVANLIREFTIFGGVDPNKVFIMGYSHGGYGAFAIGPKMPDHFAAIHCSAGAPTDGETSAETLRNTVFTYMIGENDHAYGRLERCRAFDESITKLRGDRADIYPVKMEFRAGFGHGGLPDRDKIKEMYPAVRNPAPRELSWEMTDGVIHDFYWLHVANPAKKQEIIVTCRDNRITVQTKEVKAAAALVDARLVDFKRPLRLEVNGKSSTVKIQPSLRTLAQTMLERGDPDLAFTAKINLGL